MMRTICPVYSMYECVMSLTTITFLEQVFVLNPCMKFASVRFTSELLNMSIFQLKTLTKHLPAFSILLPCWHGSIYLPF